MSEGKAVCKGSEESEGKSCERGDSSTTLYHLEAHLPVFCENSSPARQYYV